jgi:protein O-mannosyl-transferase
MGQPSRNNRDRNPLPQPSTSHDYLKALAVCCFLLLMVVAVYWQTNQYEFIVCDDNPYVYGNPNVSEGFVWKDWENNSLVWCLTSDHAGNWHPLTWFSHVLDGQLYGIHDLHHFNVGPTQNWKGPEAGGHHLTSVLLHAIAAIVLFLALRKLTGAFWCSALVAAMFALHPLRAESVAWVAERKDVLSGLFWMLTLLAYGSYALRPNIGRYLAVVCMLGLGLCAKSMLVTLPCVLLLLDFWPLRRWRPLQPAVVEEGGSASADTKTGTVPQCAPQPLWWLLLEKLPLFALSAAVSWQIAKIQEHMGCMSMTDNVTPVYRVANAAFSAAAYLWKMVWPINLTQSFKQSTIVCDLAIFYPHLAVMGDDAKTRLIWYGLAGALVLVAITLLVLWNLRRRPYLAVGWFWFLGTLVPVIGLIQVGAQGMADRYTYIPMIGVTIMLVWGAAELAARSRELRMAVAIGAAVVLTAWIVLTGFQVATWKDSTSVFQHAIDVTSDNYFAYSHLGLAYQNEIDSMVRPLSPADQAKMDLAGEKYRKAVELGPSYDAANANLGAYYMNKTPRELDKALPCFLNAVRVNPHGAFHYDNLGKAYMALGDLDKAVAAFSKAIDIEGNSPLYHADLGDALLRQEKTAAAIAEFDETLRLYPNYVPTQIQLAQILATSEDASIRDGAKALKLALRATELTKRNYPRALHALAAAYAETGCFFEAVETANSALQLALKYQDRPFAQMIAGTIQVYQSARPLRLPMLPPPAKRPSPSP